MLRIVREKVEARRVVLTLQGRLVEDWSDLLELECLGWSRSGLAVVLDLSGVTFVGRSGLGALVRLARTGTAIVGCRPLVADMLTQEGIEVSRIAGDAKDDRPSGRG